MPTAVSKSASGLNRVVGQDLRTAFAASSAFDSNCAGIECKGSNSSPEGFLAGGEGERLWVDDDEVAVIADDGLIVDRTVAPDAGRRYDDDAVEGRDVDIIIVLVSPRTPVAFFSCDPNPSMRNRLAVEGLGRTVEDAIPEDDSEELVAFNMGIAD